jgi:hypothetical protein
MNCRPLVAVRAVEVVREGFVPRGILGARVAEVELNGRVSRAVVVAGFDEVVGFGLRDFEHAAADVDADDAAAGDLVADVRREQHRVDTLG